jgi:hypothetical protein
MAAMPPMPPKQPMPPKPQMPQGPCIPDHKDPDPKIKPKTKPKAKALLQNFTQGSCARILQPDS